LWEDGQQEDNNVAVFHVSVVLVVLAVYRQTLLERTAQRIINTAETLVPLDQTSTYHHRRRYPQFWTLLSCRGHAEDDDGIARINLRIKPDVVVSIL
jgi:hypothetical protein